MGYFDDKFKKGILATVLSAIVLAVIVGFSSSIYNNFAPPKVEKQMDEISGDVKDLKAFKIKSDVQYINSEKRMERIEDKLDKIIDKIIK